MSAVDQEKLSNAGDVSIEDVTIITSRGFAQTITPQVIGIEMYEDMFSTFVTGNVMVLDSQELTNLLPLIGEEVIRLRIRTPSLPDNSELFGEYYIYKMDDRTKVKERQLVYVLHFISKEAIVDLNKKISKAFTGKISDLVEKIVTGPDGFETKKPLNIEPSQNTLKYVSNFWSPVQNIQFLTDAAVNANDSPSYLFFENRNGYHFVALDTLYAGTPLHQRFVWDNYSAEISSLGGSRRSAQQDYQRILDLEMSDTFDYIHKLKSGMYGSEVIYYDILTKQYVHKGYGPDFKETRHLNEFPLYSTSIAARPKAVLIHEHKYYNNFDGFDDTSNTKIVQKRKSLLAQAEGYKIKITVFGRTDYAVGQRVYLEIPRNTQLTKDDPEYLDKLLSGNYLISALCHTISREKHECVMELVKDSYMVNLNDTK